MEIRLRSILLATTFLALMMPATELVAQSDEIDEGESTNLIEPQIERVEFDESQIDSYDFELAIYGGALVMEHFDTNPVVGLKIGYHVSEDFFVQGSYGKSDVGETSFERLSGGAPLLSDSERDVEYYLFSIGFNLLPSEAFLTDSTTLNTVLYVSGGMGVTEFAGDDRSTIAFAVGYRTIFIDGFSVDVEVRDLIFDLDTFGEDETTHNIELTLALNLFF
jgi:outer membrane beta-barrel protein